MKDMSVKELIVKCGVGWNDFKAELLRRYESLKCCGNCKLYIKDNCPYCKLYHGWPRSTAYCDSWHSDNLTRAEREGK